MMIYNTFPNPEDPMADIEVEVFQFENRVAYPSKKCGTRSNLFNTSKTSRILNMELTSMIKDSKLT